jgi:ACS family tartrate transporter-like MFS transporter
VTTPLEEAELGKRVERQLLLRIASLVFLLYFSFAIDRGNIGFAALQMNAALGLTAEVFGFGSGLFTLAYLLFQAPNAEMLRRLGPRRGFALVACGWGLVSTSTAFVPDQTWFLINRFALGVTEAGFHAFIIYYISTIFPQRIRGFAVGVSFVAVPFSMIVASPLSGVLLNLEWGTFAGWQSLFIIEGIPSVVLGLLCLKFVPDTVRDMRFLSSSEQDWLERELGAVESPEKHATLGANILRVLANPVVWALGLVLLTMVLAVNVMTIWMPLMIRQVSGAGNLAVGALNSLPWIAFSIGCVLASRMSDKVADRATPLRASVALATVGFLLCATLQDVNTPLAFGVFLLACVGAGGAQGSFWALAMSLLSGVTAAAAFAMITVIGNGSGIIAHPLIGRLHDATGSFGGVVWTLALFYVAAFGVLYWIVKRRNSPQPEVNARLQSDAAE